MVHGCASRWVVIGNSGSGKSTLADHVGECLGLPVFDLDLVHWRSYGERRDKVDAMARVDEMATTDDWVLEGIYGWLVEVALPRATALIWLDLSWDDCRDGLLARGLRRGMTPNDQRVLLVWAREYWTRATSSSFAGHERLYSAFLGNKARLRSRVETAAFMRRVTAFDEWKS